MIAKIKVFMFLLKRRLQIALSDSLESRKFTYSYLEFTKENFDNLVLLYIQCINSGEQKAYEQALLTDKANSFDSLNVHYWEGKYIPMANINKMIIEIDKLNLKDTVGFYLSIRDSLHHVNQSFFDYHFEITTEKTVIELIQEFNDWNNSY